MCFGVLDNRKLFGKILHYPAKTERRYSFNAVYLDMISYDSTCGKFKLPWDNFLRDSYVETDEIVF